MRAPQTISQPQPHLGSSTVREERIGEIGFAIIARDGSFGQQDKPCIGRHRSQQIMDILHLPFVIAVEFLVAVDIRLDDAHLDRAVGRSPPFALPNPQRADDRQQ